MYCSQFCTLGGFLVTVFHFTEVEGGWIFVRFPVLLWYMFLSKVSIVGITFCYKVQSAQYYQLNGPAWCLLEEKDSQGPWLNYDIGMEIWYILELRQWIILLDLPAQSNYFWWSLLTTTGHPWTTQVWMVCVHLFMD